MHKSCSFTKYNLQQEVRDRRLLRPESNSWRQQLWLIAALQKSVPTSLSSTIDISVELPDIGGSLWRKAYVQNDAKRVLFPDMANNV